METRKVKISEVKRNPNNPRIIQDGKFDKLVKSIRSEEHTSELQSR
jgi:ParB-like chromosome segregation protein Spo0J